MQFRFFKVPAAGCPETEGELNRFLRSVRVLRVDREFSPDGRDACWSLCVEYLESPKAAASARPDKVDYRALLSERDFALFAKLREMRKRLADRDAVPPYAVFTNEHLAEIARQRPATAADLRKIDGIGDAKAKKYGEEVLAEVTRWSVPGTEGGGEAGR